VGHIAVPLAQLGVMLGFRVIVLDDRTSLRPKSVFPMVWRPAHRFPQPFAQVELNDRSYVVLVRARTFTITTVKGSSRGEQPAYVG
jgi:hypothetical protein